MFDLLLFVGLPYLALGALVAGTAYRLRYQGLTVSALSSQALEARSLPWGSLPWHIGIFVVIAGHLVAFIAPDAWRGLMAQRWALLAAETFGLAAAALCAIGLTVLLIRRVIHARLQAVTSRADLTVLVLLLAQVLLGIATAVTQRWGASWSTSTTTPYLWSLLTLSPDVTYVADMPGVIKLHLALAWLLFLIAPFTRLIHAVTVPIQYLWRLPQRVVWMSTRRAHALTAADPSHTPPEDSRRALVRGLFGMAAAIALLATGVAGRIFQYFRGPSVARADKEALLSKRLTQLKVNAHERSLQLERLQHDHILVAKLPELDPKVGKYFIDYHMRPSLAFLDPKSGLPILLSARCTHLGCTVSNTLDDQDRVLCPCHVSYFDIRTGQPNAGAPATEPLPRIGFLLKTPDGAIAASQDANGSLSGTFDPNLAHTYSVFIARPDA